MTQAKSLSQEIRERLPRVLLDFVIIVITLLVAYFVVPIASAISFSVPVIGLSVGLMVAVVFVVILAVLAVRILRDAAALLHLSSHALSSAVPGLEEHHVNLVRKVAYDFGYVIVILILFYVLTPFIVLIPGVGVSLAAAIPLILVAIVVVLLYDAARLLYDEIGKGVHQITEKVASVVEESEKKTKK